MKKIILISVLIVIGLSSCKKENCKPEKPVVLTGPRRSPDRIPSDSVIVWVPGGLR